jgi:AAA family ATP:ADP antiporter
MKNPFKAFMDIQKKELPFAILMFAYFFLVITNFWILKPLKKAAFVGFYKESGLTFFSINYNASQVELFAKIANMFVAMGAVIIFSWLARRFIRQQLTIIFSLFFLACYAAFSFVLESPKDLTVWSFYLFGDLFSTLMVATFFIFLNDSVNPDSAKRLYGLVGLGGVLGGAFGSITVKTLVKSGNVSSAAWMWICFGITTAIALVALFAGKRVALSNEDKKIEPSEPVDNTKKQENPALAGAKLVFRSPYLFAIVSIVGLYEIVSTLLDFQFTSTILHFITKENLSDAFSTAFMYMNITAVIVQLFLTSFIMRKFGLTVALIILPAAVLLVSMGYLIFPIMAVAMLIPSSDGGFSYSLNQSAKEALYVPTSKDEKYKAKAFIDMFIQRFAKVLAIGVSLVITSFFKEFSTIRWLSLGTLCMVILWLIAVRFAGHKFTEMTSKQENL